MFYVVDETTASERVLSGCCKQTLLVNKQEEHDKQIAMPGLVVMMAWCWKRLCFIILIKLRDGRCPKQQ